MKNLLIIVAVVIIINSLTVAQTSTTGSATDFRGFDWGSSIIKVKANEKAKPWKINEETNNTDDVLFYDDQLAGSDVTVIYQFNDNDKLINGTYIFAKKYSDPQLYLQDYDKFRELLTLKYGKPKLDNENGVQIQLHLIKKITDRQYVMDTLI